ncbi:MAG TPA: hypothetical protein VKZ85_08370 [Woeseiaceae bacterium]|nr:hypothetical protein [Woeseiaceae bacterium]
MSDPVNPVKPILPPWAIRPTAPARGNRQPGERKRPVPPSTRDDADEDDDDNHRSTTTIDEYV